MLIERISILLNEIATKLSFGPEHGDWSGALVTILFGFAAFFGYIYRSVKSLNEAKEQRKEQERLRIAEENESFMKYRERFQNLWFELTKNGRVHLYKNYRKKDDLYEACDKDEKEVNRIKTLTYQIIALLSDIEFVYCNKQQTSYWKKWDSTFKHVFSKPLFKTAWTKHSEEFRDSNYSYIEYVESIIQTKKEEELDLNNEEVIKA